MDIAYERSFLTPASTSPLLPLLLLSLARQKNAPTPSNTFFDEYDYIVVGAGSAGSVVASRLSEIPCIRILLLEAGPAPPIINDVPGYFAAFHRTPLDWDYKTEPQKNTAKAMRGNEVPWPSGKALGGSGILNGMLYVRGNRKNYDEWAEQGAKGWRYSDVLPYFLKAEDNQDTNFVENGYHATGGPLTVEQPPFHSYIKDSLTEAIQDLGYDVVDPNGRKQTGFSDFQSSIRNGQRCSAAKAYLVPAENRENLDILTGAFVKKIILENGRATGVEFDYRNGTYVVGARREVILSAGTTNSAQLLMLSGIGPEDTLRKFNIPMAVYLPVGQNFQEHGGPFIFFSLPPNIPTFLQQLSDNLAEYIATRKGILTSIGMSYLAFLKDSSEDDFPDYQLYFGETDIRVMKAYGIKQQIYDEVFAPYENQPIFYCGVSTLQPKSRGYVSIRSANPYDPPIIDPNYYSKHSDFVDVVNGLKKCMEIVRSEPMRRLGSEPLQTVYPECKDYMGNEEELLKCVARMFVYTYSHQVGTCKMGDPEDSSTVVDPELRVKGIKGLRVVDASVMPIVPSGNTNAITMMLAEKASDLIKSSLYSNPQT